MLRSEAIIDRARVIPSYTHPEERQLLCDLAGEIAAGGHIVEIGCLYGGMTAVLALANPSARITCIDDFSWNPRNLALGADALLERLRALGAANLPAIVTGDSQRIGKSWTEPIDLLWIDGGHNYECVSADLANFGPHARVIALHDFANPYWAVHVMRAVAEFLRGRKGWALTAVAHYTVVLRKEGANE